MSANWGDFSDFEEAAGKSIPLIEKMTTREFFVALALFGAGLVAMYYESIVLGAALLVLALHYDQQSNKSHTLLVLTAYHRAIYRTILQHSRRTDDQAQRGA
jgi:hypothetical protein